MASEAASYLEYVEQLQRRFVEFRELHAVRSRLPEELGGDGGKAGTAGWDHRYSAGAGRALLGSEVGDLFMSLIHSCEPGGRQSVRLPHAAPTARQRGRRSLRRGGRGTRPAKT